MIAQEMEPKKYNCLVVDDEPIARKIIINYIAEMPLLKLAGESINALGAIDHLRTHHDVDIIFLDINMPNLYGLQFLQNLNPTKDTYLNDLYITQKIKIVASFTFNPFLASSP